jgi:F-type H+-transporting ATPase subunit epsilon
MRLRVLAPDHVVLDAEVAAVIAESLDGSFCLLPHHVDVVAALSPSLLAYRTAAPAGSPTSEERFLAVDGGTLVKCADAVLVSSPRVVFGPGLDDLRTTIEASFRALEEDERAARAAIGRLESDIVRRFVEFERHG